MFAEAEIVSGGDMLVHSAEAVREAYADTDPDLREAINRGENPIIDISVSFDGTWQKRGFTSLYGVGICIDVLTGYVVDYAVLSKYCHACKLQEAKNLPEAELVAWREEHAADCCRNHHQSSKSMEQEAAKIMWQRSVEKFSFRYVEMLSDGDSAAYKAVCDIAPYGEKVINKLECVNHAHKRMGTALRKLAKEERLGRRGVGRLTENKCDSLQNFYRGAILNNIPNIDKMRSAVWASLFHSMSTDASPQHQRCPEGVDSKCFYQKALARGEQPGSHQDHPSHTALSREVAEKMLPVYRRMSDENLLRRMVHGGTQNTNECLNSTIWARCPKTSFLGLKRVEGSVARAVCVFNEGAHELVGLMNKVYMDISFDTLRLLAEKDERRMKKGDAAAKIEAQRHRKEHTLHGRQQAMAEDARDGDVDGAGAH